MHVSALQRDREREREKEEEEESEYARESLSLCVYKKRRKKM